MSDIIDRIDQLVDAQMADGETRSDFLNNDPAYPKCPHCGRHWHGLRITERIAQMYAFGHFDPGYSAAEDDSPVVCEGSEFIGPMKAPTVDSTPLGSIDIFASAESYVSRMIDSILATLSSISFGFEARFDLHWGGWAEPETASCPPEGLVEFGPANWIYELIPQTTQFPHHPRYRSLIEDAVHDQWEQFTAPEHPAPAGPGIDFEALKTQIEEHPSSGPALPPLRKRQP